METETKEPLSEVDKRRQDWMSVLALSDSRSMIAKWETLGIDPECHLVRGPETGLVALRGRMGGGGAPFNFGEATVTRATIKLGNGELGHSVMMGRDHLKAKLAAVVDALAADDEMRAEISTKIIEPLREEQQRRDQQRADEAAATKVDFFTMVRGDD